LSPQYNENNNIILMRWTTTTQQTILFCKLSALNIRHVSTLLQYERISQTLKYSMVVWEVLFENKLNYSTIMIYFVLFIRECSYSNILIYIENKITKYFILFFIVRCLNEPQKWLANYIILYNYYESVITVHCARTKCVPIESSILIKNK